MDWEHMAGAILAVGALGTAAFGVVEALGKAVALRRWGLPFAGYSHVKAVVDDFAKALEFTYSGKYEDIVRQHYREGRGNGRAPDTIRNGVRLALPMMDAEEARTIVGKAWGLPAEKARTLVEALQAEKVVDPKGAKAKLDPKLEAEAAVLATRFAMALDSRVSAAFTLAEERYQALTRLLAGTAAVLLSLLFNLGLRGTQPMCWDGKAATKWTDACAGAQVMGDPNEGYAWVVALIIGAAAVPLAPVAKDLSSALTEALKAWKQVGAATRS